MIDSTKQAVPSRGVLLMDLLNRLATRSFRLLIAACETPLEASDVVAAIEQWRAAMGDRPRLRVLDPYAWQAAAENPLSEPECFDAVWATLDAPVIGQPPTVTVIDASQAPVYDDGEWGSIFEHLESARGALAQHPGPVVLLAGERILANLRQTAPLLLADCEGTIVLPATVLSFDLLPLLEASGVWREPAPEIDEEDARVQGGKYTIFRLLLPARRTLWEAQQALAAHRNEEACKLACEVIVRNERSGGDLLRFEESRAHALLAAGLFRARRFDEGIDEMRIAASLATPGEVRFLPFPGPGRHEEAASAAEERDAAWLHATHQILQIIYENLGYKHQAADLRRRLCQS